MDHLTSVALIIGDYGSDHLPVAARSRLRMVIFAGYDTPGEQIRRFIETVAPEAVIERFVVERRRHAG